MNLIITTQKENPLLSRKEIVGDLTFDKSTPPRTEVRKSIADHLKVSENLVVLDRIDTTFGYQKAVVFAHVYAKQEDVTKFEPAYLRKRDEKGAKAAAKEASEAKPAAEEKPAENKPAEEKKDASPEAPKKDEGGK